MSRRNRPIFGAGGRSQSTSLSTWCREQNDVYKDVVGDNAIDEWDRKACVDVTWYPVI